MTANIYNPLQQIFNRSRTKLLKLTNTGTRHLNTNAAMNTRTFVRIQRIMNRYVTS